MTIHQGVYHQVKRMIAAVGTKSRSYIDIKLVNWFYLKLRKGLGIFVGAGKQLAQNII